MDSQTGQTLPQARPALTGLKAVSDRFASWFDWTTPNLVTAAGTSLVSLVFAGFLGWRLTHGWVPLIVGIAAYILAALSDWLDGALATRQLEQDGSVDKTESQLAAEAALPIFDQLRLRGRTTFGKKFDPMRDKVMFYSVLLTLGIGFLPVVLIAANLLMAFLLTAIRWKWVMDRFGFVDAAANTYGKTKMHCEVATVCTLVLLMWWPFGSYWASVVALSFATYYAVRSFRAHWLNRRVVLAGPRH